MKPRRPILLRKTYQSNSLTRNSEFGSAESARYADVIRYVRQYVLISISCERLSKGRPKALGWGLPGVGLGVGPAGGVSVSTVGVGVGCGV